MKKRYFSLLCVDLKRSVLSKNFLISTFSVTFIYFASSFYEFRYYWDDYKDVLSIFDFIHNVGSYVTVLIFASAFCFSWSYISDLQENAINFYIVRIGKKGYAISKIISTAVSGGLSVASGLFFYIVFLSWHLPLINTESSSYLSAVDRVTNGVTFCLDNWIIGEKWFLVFGGYLVLAFLICSLYAVLGLVSSAIVLHKYVAVFFPYFIFFSESAFPNIFKLKNRIRLLHIMLGNFNFVDSTIGNIITVVIIVVIFLILFSGLFIFLVKRNVKYAKQ